MEQLQRSLGEMAQRIQQLHDELPNYWNQGEDLVTDNLVSDIMSIESEWILDEELRAEFSCIMDAPDDEDKDVENGDP